MGDGLDYISDLSLCFLKDQYFSTNKGKKKHIKKNCANSGDDAAPLVNLKLILLMPLVLTRMDEMK